MKGEKKKRNSSKMSNKRSSIRISKKLEESLKDYESLNVLRYETSETLKVCNWNREYYMETDKNFITDVEKIAKIRRNIIFNLFDKKKQKISDPECDEIDFKARIHRQANIINSSTRKQFEQAQKKDQCQCGCKRAKGDDLPICTDEQRLNVLGPGVILMFMFKRALFVNLVVVLLLYGIYSLVTNLMGSQSKTCERNDDYCRFVMKASNEEKVDRNYTTEVQLYLGLVFCIIWVFTLRFIKYLGREKNKMVDERLKSASDYAIKIQNLPYGTYSQIQLIDYFEGLWEKMKLEEAEEKGTMHKLKLAYDDADDGNHYKMKSIQIIYNMEFSRQMIEQIFYLSYLVDSSLEKIEGQKGKQFVKKVQEYKSNKMKLKQTYELLVDLRKKFLNDSEFRKSISTTCCIIEFEEQHMKKRLLQHFGIEKMSILKQVQTKIKKIFNPESKDIIFKGNVIKIERAPEPSDILWTNCQKTFSFKRIFVIYFVTLLIIIFSFSIIIGLDYAKEYVANNDISNDTEVLTIINIATSAALLIVNKFLWFALFYLLELQYNHTLTQKIISQMNKVLLASSINVIVLPIISNFVIRSKLYALDGLSGLVFDYQISVIVGLIVKLLDPLFVIKKIVIEVKCLRNLFIRWTCNNLPDISPEKGVNEVNKFYEGSYFDVAETYVYIIGAIIHAAFFCFIQPFTIFLVTIMVIVFYFINKLKILRYCKIPEMTELLVFQTAISQSGLVPIVYGVGSIVVQYMAYTLNSDLQIDYVPSGIAIGIGLFGFFNPCDVLNKIVKKIMEWFECISVEKLIGDESQNQLDDNNPTNQVAQTLQVEDKVKTKRIQVYSQGSNALTLLGFEKLLKGEQEKQIMSELQSFCESFFPKNKNSFKSQALNFVNNYFSDKKAEGLFSMLQPQNSKFKQIQMGESEMKPKQPTNVMSAMGGLNMIKDEGQDQMKQADFDQ